MQSLFPEMTEAEVLLAQTNIWRLYERAAATTAAKRTGYEIDHVRHELSDWLFKERSESVAEHSLKFGILWGAAMMYFPDLLYAEHGRFFSLFFAMIHDLPEGDPKGPGDVPDNGCEEHDDAKDFERQSMGETLNLLPDETAQELMRRYDAFEAYKVLDTGEVTMQACKLFDKLEAIFSLLYDEKRFIKGYIDSTPEYDNEIDFMRAEYLGTKNPTDVWTFGLRKIMANKKVEPELANLIMGLLKVAFLDVRHEIPRCLTATLDLCD